MIGEDQSSAGVCARAHLHALALAAGRLVAAAIWILAMGAYSEFEPLPAFGYLLALALAFTLLHLWLPARSADGRSALRLRSPVAGPRWVAMAALAAGLLKLGLIFVELTLDPTAAASTADTYRSQPLGWLPVYTGAVIVGPLLEETIFRGWLQPALERRVGPIAGVVVAAAIFTWVHSQKSSFAWQHFLLGLLFGSAVWVSGSLWTGVLLHTTTNGVVAALYAFFPGWLTPEFWRDPSPGVQLATITLTGAGTAALVVMGVRAGRPRTLPASRATRGT